MNKHSVGQKKYLFFSKRNAIRKEGFLLLGIVQLLMLLWSVSLMAATTSYASESPNVPRKDSQMYYAIGGGRVLPPPDAGYNTVRLTANLVANYNYSCGNFNYEENIKKMVDDIGDRLNKIPMQVRNAVLAAVPSLPYYFLSKVNPNLKQYVDLNLNKVVDIFEVSIKSCKEIEKELKKDPNADVSNDFVTASFMEKWHTSSSSGALAADTEEDINEDPPTDFTWTGGEKYGTSSKPAQINRDMVIAGYNVLINRGGDVNNRSAPNSSIAQQYRVAQIWSSPIEAADWAVHVIGDKEIIIGDSESEKTTMPELGVKTTLEKLAREFKVALLKAINEDKYSGVNKFSSIGVSSSLVDSFRLMGHAEAELFMDRLAEEVSINETVDRLFLIKRLILTGIETPDLSGSPAYGAAKKYIDKQTLPAITRNLDEIAYLLDFKSRTTNKTALQVLRYANSVRQAGSQTPISSSNKSTYAIGGAMSSQN